MKYPIGIQSFETMRQGGFVYVDKTDQVYRLAQGHICFLCRPRRFGKSLLVSTLKAYFQGRRDLFQGLRMEQLETEWQQYPVLLFDFNGIDNNRPNALYDYLATAIEQAERAYGVAPQTQPGTNIPSDDIMLRFRHLIAELHRLKGQRVVVLIDEYDKPLLDLLETGNDDDDTLLNRNRNLLKVFFSVFKATDEHLRFVLLTGITKFSQVSMFSGFNQPDDISFDARFDTLLGITEQELRTTFAPSIQELADEEGLSTEQTMARLKDMYDGYHFSRKLVDVYNPFSIINTFANNDIRSYWFKSGTPSYVVRLLARCHEDLMHFTKEYHSELEFLDYKADREAPLPILFQSCCLTIKAVDREFDTYLLDFPNREVRQGMVTLLANNYLQPADDSSYWMQRAVKALNAGDTDLFRRQLTAFLAETPYAMRPKKDEKDRELYFHYTFYLLMRLISCYTVYTEKQLSQGRADCIVETPKYIYIFEFKLDGTARQAIEQIRQKGYATPYLADSRQLFIVGASFSSTTGTIDDWQEEKANY